MKFVVRRLLITLPTLFLVSVITFAAFHIIPGDPAAVMLGIEATEAQLEALRAEMNLDKGLPVQYGLWLGRFFTGNLGNSARFRGEPIAGMILERLPVTLSLAVLSMVFIFLLAIPTALLPAGRENSLPDRAIHTITTVMISFPGFFLGVLLIWIFGVVLKFFVPGAYVSYRQDLGGFLAYLVFPALAIAMPNAAIVVKFLRGSVFRQLGSDYVRTAYSKGNSRGRVLYRHVLKNAAIPAVTLMGMITADVFSGSIVIEQVFTIPGIGRLLIASITSRDFSMAQVLVVYIAVVVVLANTLADIAIRIIDPRIDDSRISDSRIGDSGIRDSRIQVR
ncbi:MAG: ABC transporter permease [Treponema sp.]|jgi:ABC-type dipeptide/oligopeptide/nickel transport system permease component|nr:ABC transporter permease [Treponema sp.]